MAIIESISASAFEARREEGRTEPGDTFRIRATPTSHQMYAYTDDGQGFFFYDTAKELRDNHGY